MTGRDSDSGDSKDSEMMKGGGASETSYLREFDVVLEFGVRVLEVERCTFNEEQFVVLGSWIQMSRDSDALSKS